VSKPGWLRPTGAGTRTAAAAVIRIILITRHSNCSRLLWRTRCSIQNNKHTGSVYKWYIKQPMWRVCTMQIPKCLLLWGKTCSDIIHVQFDSCVCVFLCSCLKCRRNGQMVMLRILMSQMPDKKSSLQTLSNATSLKHWSDSANIFSGTIFRLRLAIHLPNFIQIDTVSEDTYEMKIYFKIITIMACMKSTLNQQNKT